jgi:hypothetical protein
MTLRLPPVIRFRRFDPISFGIMTECVGSGERPSI